MRRTLVILLTAAALIAVPGLPASSASAPTAVTSSPASNFVTAPVVAKRLKSKRPVTFIDTRDSVDGETVAGAIVAPPYVIEAWAKRAKKTDYIVAYCTCEDDGLAISAVDTLRKLGFTNAWVLKGGLDAARSAGIPMGAPSM